MAYIFKKQLVPSNKYHIKCPHVRTPKFVVIHNTFNDASPKNEINYMISNNNQTSFHVAIGEDEVIQAVPFDRNAWACGDGANGQGNRYGISLEICYSKSGGDRYTQAEENAVYVAARLLYQFGLGIDKLKQHADFAKKNCPHRIRDEKRWDSFKDRVRWVLDEIKKGNIESKLENGSTGLKPNKPVENQPTTQSAPTQDTFKVKITCKELNVRKSASFDSAVVTTVKKGDVFTIVEVQNGLGLLKSYKDKRNGWISMNSAYVQKI